jgi:hypothetical protein
MRHTVPPILLVAAGLFLTSSPAVAQFGEGAEGLAAPEPGAPEPPVPPPPAAPPAPPEAYAGDAGRQPAPPQGAADQGRPASAEVSMTESGEPIPGRIATRLRVLDNSLTILARWGTTGVVDGILSLLGGGLSITMGAITNDGSPDRQRFARYLYLWGSGQIARGILKFALPLRADDVAIEYQHMPMANPAEVRDRLLFGERALERLARRARTARLLDASINTGVGALAIPMYLAPADFEIRSGNDYFVIIAAGISLITGVVGFILRTDAERRWSAYKKLRDRLDGGGTDTTEPPPESPRAAGARWEMGVGAFGARF